MDRINLYLESLHLQEDIADLLPNINPTSMSKKIQANLDPDDLEKSIKIISRFTPKISPKIFPKVDNYMESKYDNYKRLRKRANVVLTNSLDGLSPTIASMASSFITLLSMYAPKGKENLTPEQNLNKNLKELISRSRKFASEHEDEEKNIRASDYYDIAVAWTIVVMGTGVAIGLGTGSYIFLKLVSAGFVGALSILANGAVVLALLGATVWMLLKIYST